MPKKPHQSTDDIDQFLDEQIAENKKQEQHTHRSENIKEKIQKAVDDLLNIAAQMKAHVKRIIEKCKDPNQMTAAEKINDLSKPYDETKFLTWSDTKKLEYFERLTYRDKSGKDVPFKEFMDEFIIVARYMITMGTYKTKAFKRLLEKIRIVQHPPPNERAPGYMEDQWIRRQADYVRFLWEECQDHPNMNEACRVWEDTYKKLKGEFDDFRNKYKDTEEQIKKDKERRFASTVRDLLHKFKNNPSDLTETEINMIKALDDLAYKRNYKDNVQPRIFAALRTKVPVVPAVTEAMGAGPEEEQIDDKQPKIRMIEHVDPDRLHEVPRELLLDKKTAAELPFTSDEDRVEGVDIDQVMNPIDTRLDTIKESPEPVDESN